ncbi:MAG TPA: hypothetical protein VGD50_04525, partial [Candidatus Baltobacteraceae bacterium]
MASVFMLSSVGAYADSAPAAPTRVLDGSLLLDRVEGSAVADGESLVQISGRILDADGKPVNGSVDVTLRSSMGAFIGTDDSDAPGFHVTSTDGMFQAALQAPTHSGTALVFADAGKLHAQTKVIFTTSLRHGISAGVIDFHLGASNTDYHAPFEQFLSDDSSPWTLQTTAFFQGPVGTASGSQAQLTAAFDNQNAINGDCSGITPIYGSTNQQTACTPRYGIYGDASTATSLANSSDNAYVRLEKNADFVEWGDYDTSEFSSQGQTYGATSRQLHGAKGSYSLGRLSVTGLYATNVQAFQRDIIAPDGTSGNYYLSRQLILPGSEAVQLELEPLNRPGTVVGETALTAGVDYELNPETGSLLFTQPIAQTQTDPVTGMVLVQHIVVTYQYDGGSSSDAL